MSIGYWISASGAIATNIIRDAVSPRARRFDFTRTLLRSGIIYRDTPRLPSRHFLDVCPQAETLTVPLGDVRFRRSNANPYEVYCLVALAALAKPRRVFEIGTFDGATTLRLAIAAPEAAVFTLDLPSDASASHPSEVPGEHDTVISGEVGHRYRDTPQAARIHQLFGNSRTFDYTPYHGTCDFIFVDACHEYEFARSDSHSALKLLSPGGTIVWHDYIPGWPGVVKAVDELLPLHNLVHIAGTSLAVLKGGAA